MLVVSYKLAHAAGLDAGNRSMRAAGRKAWSEQDRQAASDTMLALLDRAPETVLTWTSDGDDRRTMVGRGDGRKYVVLRMRKNGVTGYVGATNVGPFPWSGSILNGEVPFKRRQDAMAACERHAAGEG